MSVRRAALGLCTAARSLFNPIRTVHRSNIHSKIRTSLAAPASVSPLQSGYDSARRLFLQTVLSRVTNNVSSDLRRRTTRQLLYGNSTPFFAFVGISLASGGILKKEDELEGLCVEIREAVGRMQKSTAEAESDIFSPGEEATVNQFTIGPYIGKGCNAAIFAVRKSDSPDKSKPNFDSESELVTFPFAMKMMFNYCIESNAASILRGMFSETVPAVVHYRTGETIDWEEKMADSYVSLPPHPNIVSMHCAFADQVPSGLPAAFSDFAQALPFRLNDGGLGRNMTLFILMKRYDMNLKKFLAEHSVTVREGVLMLTQLLEGVAHCVRHGVAHRDLKSDNILVEIPPEENECARLVISDFGCCLADVSYCDLRLPFRTYDTVRGGNPALMAPEVVTAQPGLVSYIDYTKADAWAVGAIAYELFGSHNPFYAVGNSRPLSSGTYYESDLPPLPAEVPEILHRTVHTLLTRSVKKRLSAEEAADVLQLYLWAPSSWTNSSSFPSNSEIIQWLLTLTTKVMTTAPFGRRRSAAEYLLIGSFLRRVKLRGIRKALHYIQN